MVEPARASRVRQEREGNVVGDVNVRKLRLRRVAAGVGVMAVAGAVAAGPAWGVHWPFFGGDAGRSGFQPVDPGTGPLDFVYSRTGPEDRDIVNSIVTSALTPDTQRVIWGSADGRIHQRVLATGALVGPAGGVDVSDQINAFGDGAIGSVSFGETSSGTALGQIFAPHNDAAGVSIAQVDETTGALVQDVALAAAANFDVNSSVMLTGAAADGSRALFFVAQDNAGTQALFRVPITSAATTGATIGAATRTADINATPEASPTLVFLEAPGGTAGTGVAYLAVGTLDGRVLTFSAADLTPGPSATVAAGETVMTPVVPVAGNGLTPGSAGTGTAKAPFLYAASVAKNLFANPTSRVHRLTQTGTASTFTVASSGAQAGAASSALMTDQVVATATGAAGSGSVFLATERNLYALRTGDLTVSARLSANDSLVPGATGFRATVPAGQGNRVVVTTDSGRQLVLDSTTLQPVPGAEFTQDASNNGSSLAIGQPSISRGFVQFASNRGLFVYKFRTAATPPTTTPPTTTPPGDPGQPAATTNGYLLTASDGGVFAFGDAVFRGSTGALRLNSPVVGTAATPSGNGYWLVAADGGIFAFGDAVFRGSTGALRLNRPVVGMAATPSGNGYWLVASDGGIFAFGDAVFRGSTGALRLNSPVVGMAATPSGNGYWLVAADGGIFAFGDAVFRGSTGALRLNRPVVGMAATPSGNGYFLAASDGGIFAFGDAVFRGSTGAIRLNQPVVGIAGTASGDGYYLVAADGGIFAFGDAVFRGSTGALRLNRPIVGIATTR